MATWTPAALSSELRRLAGQCWRVVEAQHIVSTMTLVDTLAEQQLLEQLLDESKPPVPPECRHLHYLLSTPFRYGAPYPSGSRFRRAGLTLGVFYASQQVTTAVAEMAFRRLLFFAESPDTPWPANASEYTAFVVKFRTSHGLDLGRAPFDKTARELSHPTDYAAGHSLADAARTAGAQVLRYPSARADGNNLALLTCAAFASREPNERQVWRLHISSVGVRAICAFPEQRLAFGHAAFAGDPRVAAMRWDRAPRSATR
ncbi:MAG TPA: RES family NAD+ phosphorylase [Vicinamibacterales bacterium]|nr:RES family NAD+ phosphorylase [Vicinamibacterales bacterium]